MVTEQTTEAFDWNLIGFIKRGRIHWNFSHSISMVCETPLYASGVLRWPLSGVKAEIDSLTECYQQIPIYHLSCREAIARCCMPKSSYFCGLVVYLNLRCLLSHPSHFFLQTDMVRSGFLITVWCHYNKVNFLKKINKRHPIARPLGRGMGCLLWIQHLTDFMTWFLP